MFRAIRMWLQAGSLSAAVDRFRKVHERFIVISRRTPDHSDDPSESARPTKTPDRLEVDFSGEQIHLRKLAEFLKVGDRIRVLCDDGLLVAENISSTQFKLIHSQPLSDLIH